jgi:hypothetical protein
MQMPTGRSYHTAKSLWLLDKSYHSFGSLEPTSGMHLRKVATAVSGMYLSNTGALVPGICLIRYTRLKYRVCHSFVILNDLTPACRRPWVRRVPFRCLLFAGRSSIRRLRFRRSWVRRVPFRCMLFAGRSSIRRLRFCRSSRRSSIRNSASHSSVGVHFGGLAAQSRNAATR